MRQNPRQLTQCSNCLQVFDFWEAINVEDPLIQDESGKVVWINLGELVYEVVLDDRVREYLQGRTDVTIVLG
jgi:hypothetical protein